MATSSSEYSGSDSTSDDDALLIEDFSLVVSRNSTDDQFVTYYRRSIASNSNKKKAASNFQRFLRSQGATVQYDGVEDENSEFFVLQRALNVQKPGYNFRQFSSWQVKVARDGEGFDTVPSHGTGPLPGGLEAIRLPSDLVPESIAERAPQGKALNQCTKADYDTWYAGLKETLKRAYPHGVMELYELGTGVGALTMEMIGKASKADNEQVLTDWNRLGNLTDGRLVRYYHDKIAQDPTRKSAVTNFQKYLNAQGAIVQYDGAEGENSELFALQRALNVQEPGYDFRQFMSWQVKVAQDGEGFDAVPSSDRLPGGLGPIRLSSALVPESIAKRAPRGKALNQCTIADYQAWYANLSEHVQHSYPGAVAELYELGTRVGALRMEMIGKISKAENEQILADWNRLGILMDDQLIRYYRDTIASNANKKSAATLFKNFLLSQGAIVRYDGVEDANSEFFILQRALIEKEPRYDLRQFVSWQVNVSQEADKFDAVPSFGTGSLPGGLKAIQLPSAAVPLSIIERAVGGKALNQSTETDYDAWYVRLSKSQKNALPRAVAELYELGMRIGALTMEMIGKTSKADNEQILTDWLGRGILTDDQLVEYYRAKLASNDNKGTGATSFKNFLRAQGAMIQDDGIEDENSDFFILQHAINVKEPGYDFRQFTSWQVKAAKEGEGFEVTPSCGLGSLPGGLEAIRLPSDAVPWSMTERVPRGKALNQSTHADYEAWYEGLSKSLKATYPSGVTELYELGTRIGALTMEMIGKTSKAHDEQTLSDWYRLGRVTDEDLVEYYRTKIANNSNKKRPAATNFLYFLRKQGATVKNDGVEDENSEFSILQRAFYAQEPGHDFRQIRSWQVKAVQGGEGFEAVPSYGAASLPRELKAIPLPSDLVPASIAERVPRGKALNECTKAEYDAWCEGLSKSAKAAYPSGVQELYKLGTRIGALRMEMIGETTEIETHDIYSNSASVTVIQDAPELREKGKRKRTHDDSREMALAPGPSVCFGAPRDVVPRENLESLKEGCKSLKGRAWITDDVMHELVAEWRTYNEMVWRALGQEDVYFFTPGEMENLGRNPDPEFEAVNPEVMPSNILERIEQPILVFPINHENKHWTYAVYYRPTGTFEFYDSMKNNIYTEAHEDLGHSDHAQTVLSNIYHRDLYAFQQYPDRPEARFFEKNVPQLDEHNDADCLLHVLGGFAELQNKRNGQGTVSRLEEAVPFARETLREHFALRIMCNEINKAYPTLAEPINHYVCAYEFEQYPGNRKLLRLYDKTKLPEKVALKEPLGTDITPTDDFIENMNSSFTIEDFEGWFNFRVASAKRSRPSDYASSGVLLSQRISAGESASDTLVHSHGDDDLSYGAGNFGGWRRADRVGQSLQSDVSVQSYSKTLAGSSSFALGRNEYGSAHGRRATESGEPMRGVEASSIDPASSRLDDLGQGWDTMETDQLSVQPPILRVPVAQMLQAATAPASERPVFRAPVAQMVPPATAAEVVSPGYEVPVAPALGGALYPPAPMSRAQKTGRPRGSGRRARELVERDERARLLLEARAEVPGIDSIPPDFEILPNGAVRHKPTNKVRRPDVIAAAHRGLTISTQPGIKMKWDSNSKCFMLVGRDGEIISPPGAPPIVLDANALRAFMQVESFSRPRPPAVTESISSSAQTPVPISEMAQLPLPLQLGRNVFEGQMRDDRASELIQTEAVRAVLMEQARLNPQEPISASALRESGVDPRLVQRLSDAELAERYLPEEPSMQPSSSEPVVESGYQFGRVQESPTPDFGRRAPVSRRITRSAVRQEDEQDEALQAALLASLAESEAGSAQLSARSHEQTREDAGSSTHGHLARPALNPETTGSPFPAARQSETLRDARGTTDTQEKDGLGRGRGGRRGGKH